MWIGVSLAVISGFSGCSSLRSSMGLKEHEEMRSSIESYEDAEGNYVRPEGRLADRSRNSSVPKIFDRIPGIGTPPVDRDKARQLFNEAAAQFEAAKQANGADRRPAFKKAAALYKKAGKHWVSSALEQDSLMMMAESYFFAEEYPEAAEAYGKLVKDYPRNRYQDLIASRRMEIAQYWIQTDQARPAHFYNINFTDNKLPWNDTRGHGKRVLNNLRLDDPMGKLSDDATMQLATEAFEREDYETAADTFSDLRLMYPDSPFSFQAHFLGLKAVLSTYQGADYSVAPLDEADKLIRQMRKQFPKESREQQEYLKNAELEVHFHRAERLWIKADYYLKRGEYSSARPYIEAIESQYGDTPFAENARGGLEIVTAHPQDRERYLNWLTYFFPEKNNKVNRLLQQSREANAKTDEMSSTSAP